VAFLSIPSILHVAPFRATLPILILACVLAVLPILPLRYSWRNESDTQSHCAQKS
jgi:hypothetical protein